MDRTLVEKRNKLFMDALEFLASHEERWHLNVPIDKLTYIADLFEAAHLEEKDTREEVE